MKRRYIDAGYFGLLVSLTGRTNLSIRPSGQRGAPLGAKPPRPDGGTYSLKRKASQDNVKGVNALLRELTPGRRAYLVTHTMSCEWSLHDRRAAWRRCIDRFRKMDEVVAYQWMTEYHPGTGANGGTIHHHAVLVMSSYWNYAPHVTRWSMRYCNSKNGLDIRAIGHGGASEYVIDDLAYVAKTVTGGARMGLPFRWWGSSQVARHVHIQGPIECVEVQHPNCGTVSMRVTYDTATKACAMATEERHAIRVAKRIATRIKQRERKAVAIPISGTLRRLSRKRMAAKVDEYRAALDECRRKHLREERKRELINRTLSKNYQRFGVAYSEAWEGWAEAVDDPEQWVPIARDRSWGSNRGCADVRLHASEMALQRL